MTITSNIAPMTLTPLDDSSPLCRLSATELVAAYRTGDLRPSEVMAVVLERAEIVNQSFNAFVMIDHHGALSAAREADLRWGRGEPASPIDGVPVTVKDTIAVSGWPLRFGSAAIDASICVQDAPVIERLRAAGACFIGLTTTPEFGWKGVTDNRIDGTTLNPWDRTRTPGGSSGGAAVAAACGVGPIHIGTDGGGSIRIPASFCGVFGLKPSFGQVPAYPSSIFGTLAHIGPLTRTVDDAEVAMRIMSFADARDWYQPRPFVTAFEITHAKGRPYRVGICQKLAGVDVTADVRAVFDAAITKLAAGHVEIDSADLPLDQARTIFATLWKVGAALRIEQIPEERRALNDPGLLAAAEQGHRLSATEYADAVTRRAQFGQAMDRLFEAYDFIVTPTLPVTPFAIGTDQPSSACDGDFSGWLGFTYPFNLTQQPACSVPCGRTAENLPVGLQIIAGRGKDSNLLKFAQIVSDLMK